jgi:hypothetical protein
MRYEREDGSVIELECTKNTEIMMKHLTEYSLSEAILGETPMIHLIYATKEIGVQKIVSISETENGWSKTNSDDLTYVKYTTKKETVEKWIKGLMDVGFRGIPTFTSIDTKQRYQYLKLSSVMRGRYKFIPDV